MSHLLLISWIVLNKSKIVFKIHSNILNEKQIRTLHQHHIKRLPIYLCIKNYKTTRFFFGNFRWSNVRQSNFITHNFDLLPIPLLRTSHVWNIWIKTSYEKYKYIKSRTFWIFYICVFSIFYSVFFYFIFFNITIFFSLLCKNCSFILFFLKKKLKQS